MTYPEITLPGGTRVCCLKRGEAKALMNQMPGYFEHGIQLKAGDVVFDVGANIGVFSLWIYERYGPDVNVYAFEPVQPIFDVLDQNRSRLGTPNLKTFPFGLSNERANIEFTFFAAAPAISAASANRPESWLQLKREEIKRAFVAARSERGFPLLRWMPASFRPKALGFLVDIIVRRQLNAIAETATRVRCELRTLSDVIREHSIPTIDLLKIDVEGAELEVLSGIEDSHWPLIRQVVAELDSYSRDSQLVARLLRARGFTTIVFDQDPRLKEFDIGLVFARRQITSGNELRTV